MEKDEIELYTQCWNKFEEIHVRKIEYFQKIYKIFDDLNTFLLDFQKNYNSLGIDALINPREDDEFNIVVKNINKTIKIFLENNSAMVQKFVKEFKTINNIIMSENPIYEKVLSEYKKYKEKNDKMEKSQKHFIEKMQIIEDNLKEKLIQKREKISVDLKKMNQAIKDFNEYKNNVEDFNKIREIYNKDQKTLLEENYKEFFKSEFKLLDIIKKNFYIVQKGNYDLSSSMIEKYKAKKESKKEKSENEIKYINKEIEINKFKSRELPKEKIRIMDYHLKHKQFIKDNCSPEELVLASQINDDLLKILRKTVKDNYQDSGLQIQEAYLEIPDEFRHFLNFKVEINETLKEQMLNYLKEDNSLYRQLLIELGKFRADGKLFSSKAHIEFISTLLLEILKFAEAKNDLKAAKDCILLSQTYYITNEKDEKIYSFEKIKHNKWIRSSKFWRDFLELYISLEFKKFEEMYELKVKLKDNPEFKGKMKSKVAEVLFSCLVPYINNMVELNVDKRIILKIIDEILDKYRYLDEITRNNLEVFIANSSEEIEEYRKEIKENPNLEKELEEKMEKEKNENDEGEKPKNEININEENKKED